MTNTAEENRARADAYGAMARAVPHGVFFGFASHHVTYDNATHAYVDHQRTRIQQVEFTAYFLTMAEAEAFIAARPKFLGLKAYKSAFNGCAAGVRFTVSLFPTGVTGEANETGMKRVRRFLETCPVDEAVIAAAYIVNGSTVAELREAVGA